MLEKGKNKKSNIIDALAEQKTVISQKEFKLYVTFFKKGKNKSSNIDVLLEQRTVVH